MNAQSNEGKRSFRGAAWKITAAVGRFICLFGAVSPGVLSGLLIANRDTLTLAPHQIIAVCIGIAVFVSVVALYILTRLSSRWKGIHTALEILMYVFCFIGILASFYLAKLVDMNKGNIEWASNKMIGWYIILGVAVAATVLAWFFYRRKTFRTRFDMAKKLRADPNIGDNWLIIFNWTRKILYTPTVAASFLASTLMFLREADWWFFGSINTEFIGGAWFTIFFLNFIMEEYGLDIKATLVILLSIAVFLLVLYLLGWFTDFLRFFRHFPVSLNATAYLLAGLIGLLAIFTSWIRGLFCYAGITPNFMSLQQNPTGAEEQIDRRNLDIKVDTANFLARFMGFGRIIVTFNNGMQSLVFLVWGIRNREEILENIRGVYAATIPRQS